MLATAGAQGGYVKVRVHLYSAHALTEFYLPLPNNNKGSNSLAASDSEDHPFSRSTSRDPLRIEDAMLNITSSVTPQQQPQQAQNKPHR